MAPQNHVGRFSFLSVFFFLPKHHFKLCNTQQLQLHYTDVGGNISFCVRSSSSNSMFLSVRTRFHYTLWSQHKTRAAALDGIGMTIYSLKVYLFWGLHLCTTSSYVLVYYLPLSLTQTTFPQPRPPTRYPVRFQISTQSSSQGHLNFAMVVTPSLIQHLNLSYLDGSPFS